MNAGPTNSATRLLGREEELARALRALEPPAEPGVLFIHGPGGVGKTALLTELAARAERKGFEPHVVDARELSLDPDSLAETVAPARTMDRPLLVVDSFELIEPAASYLRQSLLPDLPEGGALVVAGRNPPDPSWFAEGRRPEEIRIAPLEPPDASALVASLGIEGGAAERLLSWGRGHPLALTLGARALQSDPSALSGEGPPPDELMHALLRQMGEYSVGSAHVATLGVAAIARATTPGLLAAALPDHDAEEEWEWLAGRGFVEPVGEGIALHALLRDVVGADLRRRDAQLERDLKRRIADHLYELADSRGELSKVVDLSHLIENPALRWGFMWEAAAGFYADSPRPGDVAAIDRILAEPGVAPIWSGEAMWEINRRFLERMPELGAVLRDPRGRIAGFTFVPTTAVEEPELEAAEVIGPLLRYARGLEPRAEALLMTDMSDLTGDPANGVVGMLANAALLRASRSNPRYVLMTINEEVELGQAFAEFVGGERIAELDAQPGRERLLCWMIDFGPGGFLANQRELVYRELNLEPPPRPAESGTVHVEEVRDALRDLGSPVKLAASPLARGEGVEQRAASVRERLTTAAERGFGDDPDERLLREVLRSGYLDPFPTHELAAERLHLSRSSYFRRLRQAVSRLAEYLQRQG